jgi:cyclic pyranopterin phosphate synthase
MSMDGEGKLSHVDGTGMPAMVDVGGKLPTRRRACAQAEVLLPPEVLAALVGGELVSPKGPVLQAAVLAGTLAAKRTSDLIPLCHPLPIERIAFSHILTENVLNLSCEVSCTARTGVEMEALTGAAVAALTVYDMCKALSHAIEIRSVRLLCKSGGKSDIGEAA